MRNTVGLLENSPLPRRPVLVIIAAGFEDRICASFRALRKWLSADIDFTAVIDFENHELNEPNRSALIELVKSTSASYKILGVDNFFSDVDSQTLLQNCDVFLDISGLSRELIFKCLHYLMSAHVDFSIVYTEAQIYYPQKEMLEKLPSGVADYLSVLDKQVENDSIIYSKNCTLSNPVPFKGNIEPGRLPMLISFLAFKRARLRCVLDSMEFPLKFFLVSTPVRDDLLWRKELLLKINFDIISSRDRSFIELETLSPISTFKQIYDITFTDYRYYKYNVYLSPLGSKMQTVGSFFFWYYFSDVSVLFSRPDKYFPKTFSHGAGTTFVVTKSAICADIESFLAPA